MSKAIEAPKLESLFTYRCKVRSVYDGDTMRVDVDLGFGHIWHGHDGKGVSLRLLGVDTPEMRSKVAEKAKAASARDFVLSLAPVGAEILVRTQKDDTDLYGRYLATITTIDGKCVNEELLKTGHAKEFWPT
jgi:micrococcal nuclease